MWRRTVRRRRMGSVVLADSALILPEGNIQDPVERVLDPPVSPACQEQPLGIPLYGRR